MKKKVFELLPSIIFGVLGLVFIIIYSVIGERQTVVYMQLVCGIILSFFFPIIGWITKNHFPTAFTWVVGGFIFFALYIAKGIDGYALIPYYDKILHTVFGLVGAVLVYVLFMRWNGEKMGTAGKIFFIVLATMGLGGLWEIFEYICSICFDVDPQLVESSMASGINPIYDTMMDLIVTLIGSAVFTVIYLADIFSKKHFIDRFFEIPVAENEEEATAEID